MCLNVFGALVAVNTCHSHNCSIWNLLPLVAFRWIFQLAWSANFSIRGNFGRKRTSSASVQNSAPRPPRAQKIAHSSGGAGRSASTPARVVPVAVASRPPAPRRIHAPSPALKQAEKEKMVGVSRVRHHSWPFWRAPPHRAVAHASAARNRLAPPHRRCTRFAQVPAESAEVEAADIARSAARQTVKSHGPSRRPGRRVLSPNRASRRGSKQALHSLAHLVLLSLASGFRIPLDAPVTSDSSCSGGSCGVGRRLSVSNCDKCDESCTPCGSEHSSNGASKCNTSCNHKLGSGTCSGTHTGPDGPRSDGPCNDDSYCSSDCLGVEY